MAVSICDDASTDETYDVVSSWARSTRHEVALSRNGSNMGPSKAFEKAMLSASTDYLVLLGQDDTLEPKHVTNLLSIATSNAHVAAVMPRNSRAKWRTQIKLSLRSLIAGGDPTWATFIRLLGGNAFFAPGTLIRREYWRPLIMHPANLQAQDYELWLYLALSGHLIQSKQAVKYGIHANNLHNCNPLDHDLDVGLTLRRLLESIEFDSLRSKLDPPDRQKLDCAVRERLKVHARTNPLIYAAATMNTSWDINGKETNNPLENSLSQFFTKPEDLSNIDLKSRSQLLGQLSNYYFGESKVRIHNSPVSTPSNYPRRAIVWLSRAANERKANLRVQSLPSPWELLKD